MDKTRHITSPFPLRRGFTLMITLSVLAVVITLTTVLLGYFSEVKRDSDTTKALIQADVFYADIVSQFAKFKDKKGLLRHLYKLPVSLHAAKGRFSMVLRCESLLKGVNINWLGLAHDKAHQALFNEAEALFEYLSDTYEIEDPQRLHEMLLEEMRTKRKFITTAQSRLRQKNGIISYEQFATILSRYQLEVDDQKIGAIPWRRYFSFSGTAQKIDVAYSSPELISFLFDIDLVSVREWYISKNRSPLSTFVEETGGNYAAKKEILADDVFVAESLCTVEYGAGYRFTFNYIDGEAKYFEFYGKH